MEPSGTPQPPQSAAYTTEENPVTTNPKEQRAAHLHHKNHTGHPVAERHPGDDPSTGLRDAVPSSLGWGTHGASAGEERFDARMEENVGRRGELDGEQMRAPGEGRVADAVENKPGAAGEQPDLVGDLDRKKREQAEARSRIKEDRRFGKVSDGGAAAGAGGVET